MKRKYMIMAGLSLLASAGAFAQYNPSIEVEGKYKPDVIIQDRVNLFPERQRFGTLDSRLQFDTKGIITDFTPFGVPMPATGWNDTRPLYCCRGYVSLDMGSWLNTRFRAGYRIIATQNTELGVYLRYNGTSLWKPEAQDENTETYRRKIQGGTVGAYVRHQSEGGMIDADIHYDVDWFNYYGYKEADWIPNVPEAAREDPTQTVNGVNMHVLWKSTSARDFRYTLGADLRYTGMRRAYTWQHLYSCRGARETWVTPRFGFSFGRGDRSRVGMDISGDFLNYSGQNGIYNEQNVLQNPDMYGRLSLTPYYQFKNESVEFSAGPRLDFLFNTYNRVGSVEYITRLREVERARGRVFNIAPDVRFNWHTKGFALTLEALGGTELNTLAAMREQDLYCQPFILSTLPTYVPLDAYAKVGFGPFAGFRAEVRFGYRLATDRRTPGLYTAYLNERLIGTPGVSCGDAQGYDTHGFSVSGTLAYNYGRYFGVTVDGSYQQQKGRNSYFNGIDLPKATLKAEATSNPWKSLRLGLEYDLRALRSVAFVQENTDDTDFTVRNLSLRNLAELNFRASYDVIPRLTVRLSLENLLNRSEDLLPGLPQPGFTVMGGVSYCF